MRHFGICFYYIYIYIYMGESRLRVLHFRLTFFSSALCSFLTKIFKAKLFLMKSYYRYIDQLDIWKNEELYSTDFWKGFKNVTCLTFRRKKNLKIHEYWIITVKLKVKYCIFSHYFISIYLSLTLKKYYYVKLKINVSE